MPFFIFIYLPANKPYLVKPENSYKQHIVKLIKPRIQNLMCDMIQNNTKHDSSDFVIKKQNICSESLPFFHYNAINYAVSETQPVTSCNFLPISAGDFVTATPAASSAANFSSAVPFPPEIIAPACPMRLPAGAVTPAI